MTYSRTCVSCGDTKPLGRFPKRGSGRASSCTECTRARNRARRDPRAAREARLRREYGITSDDYRRMGASQQWRCAICSRKAYPAGSRLVVDHDHTTGAVRALLCSPCNSALGLFGDKPERLHEAARYLVRHSERS